MMMMLLLLMMMIIIRYALDVRPGDAHWDHAKWVFRCSALVAVTAVEHLSHNHLVYVIVVALCCFGYSSVAFNNK